MTQRTLAGILAVPLLIGLWVAAAVESLPYVTYEPGLTVDVLGDDEDGEAIIQIEGHRTYRDDGELRMTTVFVSQPEAHNSLFELMRGWISRDSAIYPWDAIYQEGVTTEQNREEGQVAMSSSKDAATAAALTELGHQVTEAVVTGVSDGTPAAGQLAAGDVLVRIGQDRIRNSGDAVAAVDKVAAGEQVPVVFRRDGRRQRVEITPAQTDDGPEIGVQVGTRATDFPFEVNIALDSSIGGPSAGLMFSLAIYDMLTPGSLTGGQSVAGTGTIDASGVVGSIGGIQQKIVGAREADAGLFLVPPANCAEALAAPAGDMRLVRAPTMSSARESIEAWVDDPEAELPSCADPTEGEGDE